MSGTSTDHLAATKPESVGGNATKDELLSLNKVENEIPEELKEVPGPLNLASLDKQMDVLLEDIKILLDSRNKEFQVSSEAKSRVPLLPEIHKFENFRNIRKDYLDTLLKAEMPARQRSFCEHVDNEMKTFWNVEVLLDPERLLDTLIVFFRQQSAELLRRNEILLQRWDRFCQTNYDIQQFLPEFSRKQSYYREQYSDAACRYERLFEHQQEKLRQARVTEARKEAQRIEDERRGLAVLKPNARKVTDTSDQKSMNGSSQDTAEKIGSTLGAQELPENSEYTVQDLVAYLRWVISFDKENRDISYFLCKARTLAHSDRVPLLKNYNALINMLPGSDIQKSLEYFDGVNEFVSEPPIRVSKIEDFITEYDILVSFWKVETKIDLEDGRPFAYEIDHKFFNTFTAQNLELNLAPYDAVKLSSDHDYEEHDSGDNSKNLDNLTATLASLTGQVSKSTPKYKAPKKRMADWIDKTKLIPRKNQWEETYFSQLKQLKDMDLELKIELDLLLSQDHEYVATVLKSSARKVWETAAAAPNSRPISTKLAILQQTRDFKPQFEGVDGRTTRGFDFGIVLPDIREDLTNNDIIAAKKRDFGAILKSNDEYRKLDLDLASMDSNRQSANENIINTTISTIFSEHEVFAYFQMRHIKIRELRIMLLRQFNFLQSIEKRLTKDYDIIEAKEADNIKRKSWQTKSSNASSASKAFQAGEFPDWNTSNTGNKDDISRNEGPIDDIRFVVNDRLLVTDAKGVAFVYDSAFKDLEEFDAEMIRVLTHYINREYQGQRGTTEYMNELRQRMSNKKGEYVDISYLNPDADRQQMMLEYMDCHLKFLYAKIDTINAYMEAYEHTSDLDRQKALSQVIVDLIYLKPRLDLSAPYFSHSYNISTKSLQLQSRFITSVISHLIESHRQWSKRYAPSPSSKSDAPKQTKGQSAFERTPDQFFGSFFKSGLPHAIDETQKITYHHPAVAVYMAEIVPWLHHVLDILNVFKNLTAETCRAIEILEPQKPVNQTAVECVVLKVLYMTWENMATYNFQIPGKSRKPIGGMDSDVWLHNPYLADAILAEFYVPWDLKDNSVSSFGIQVSSPTYMTDGAYQVLGKDVLYKVIKATMLRSRLLYTWMEGENWRSCYEDQLGLMKINKANYTVRLGPLRYDSPHTSDETAHEEDGEEEPIHEEEGAHVFVGEFPSRDSHPLKFGGLALHELEDTNFALDSSSLTCVIGFLRPSGIDKLKMFLKIQLLEKSWFMVASEMHSLLLSEIFVNFLKEGGSGSSTDKKGRPNTGSNREGDSVAHHGDVDYKLLIMNNMNKKKQLRRLMMNAFSREFKNLSTQELTDNQKEQAITRFRNGLIDFYFLNMSEILQEDCDRTEFAKLMSDFRHTLMQSPYGKLLYQISPITTNAHYFAAAKDLLGTSEKATRYKQTVQTQDVVLSDGGLGGEKLVKLWYLPHLTEIVTMRGISPKIPKGAFDLHQRIFRNHQIFSKSLRIHGRVYELLLLVSIFGHLLQDNKRYSPQVRLLREADYIVNTMNTFRRDLFSQGEQADFLRVETYLSSRWTIWFLKVKFAMSSCIHALDMNMKHFDRKILESIYSQCVTSNVKHFTSTFDAPFVISPSMLKVITTCLPTKHLFGDISEHAKKFCDAKVTQIEEFLEEYVQSVQFAGADQDITKNLTDYLLFNLKLLTLKRHYARSFMENSFFTTEKEAALFFTRFKTRIIVPSIRLYFKQGGKGGATVPQLLSDTILAESITDLNRSARHAFDKCQMSTLQNEILRELTQGLLSEATLYFERLTDERLGRVYKSSKWLEVPSVVDETGFAFRVSDADYSKKTDIFQEFLGGLYKGNLELTQELKEKHEATVAKNKGRKGPAPQDDLQLASILEDKKIFLCKRETLGKTVIKLALDLNRWKDDRTSEQDNFASSLYKKILETVRNLERIILHQLQEKRDLIMNIGREKRLAGFEMTSDLHAEISSLSVELSALKKSKKASETRLRSKILDEYDDLVQQLVSEIAMLRNRFHEYQTANFNEVLNIVTDAKKEQLVITSANADLPEGLRHSVRVMLEHEDQLANIRSLNYELKMAIIKIRSMFTLKEQSLKSFYEKKIRKLEESAKEQEEKLWDSYRDGEARERALRKQLSKTQKQKITLELQLEGMQRKFEEEMKDRQPVASKQADNGTITARRRGTVSGGREGLGIASRPESGGKKDSDPIMTNSAGGPSKVSVLETRLKKYEGINVENLIQELANKTAIVEELLHEKRNREKNLKKSSGSNGNGESGATGQNKSRFKKSRSPSPDHPLSDQKSYASWAARAAEPELDGEPLGRKPEPQAADMIHKLQVENKALRRKLHLNGISLPPESRAVLSLPKSSLTYSLGTYNDRSVSRAPSSNARTAVATPSNISPSRPRTSLSSIYGGGRSSTTIGILKNSYQIMSPTSLPRIPDATLTNTINSTGAAKSVAFQVTEKIVSGSMEEQAETGDSRQRPQTAPTFSRRVSFHQ